MERKIKTRCPHCQTKYHIKRELEHTKIDCPTCGKQFLVEEEKAETETEVEVEALQSPRKMSAYTSFLNSIKPTLCGVLITLYILVGLACIAHLEISFQDTISTAKSVMEQGISAALLVTIVTIKQATIAIIASILVMGTSLAYRIDSLKEE